MSIESVIPSNHLILCSPLLLPSSIFPSIRVFSNESALRIRWPGECKSNPQGDITSHPLECVHAKSLSHVWLCANLWTTAHQVPLSMRFSRQEYWSGLQCPPPGDLPNPGIKPTSLTSPALAGRFFTTSTTWKVHPLEWILPKRQKKLQVLEKMWKKGNPHTLLVEK